MKLVVVVPHFAPDIAPTGTVFARIVEELAARGHRLEVVTSLPWYREHRVEPGWAGRLWRYEDTPWGRITRVHPFATSDKRNIVRRLLAYTSFSATTALFGRRGEPADGVVAMSPPLTLGLTGWAVARARKAPFVFNLQDIFPDIAKELGVLDHGPVYSAAAWLERFCYRRADAVTVLADELRDNVSAKIGDPSKVHVIPNFVDTAEIVPMERENSYRREFGLSGKRVVMYAGNVGLSQSIETLVDSAAALAHEPDLLFVINGQGASRTEVERRARGLTNVRFIDMQPLERLSEVLAAADIHVVPLRRSLSSSSVPSKTYSILAAGRPIVATVDRSSEVARILEHSGAGITVAPEDPEALTKGIRALLDSPAEAAAMGAAGRVFIESAPTPAEVAQMYEDLFLSLRR